MKSKSTRKRCAVCHSRKILEHFYANGRGGLRPECKDCTTTANEERVLARFGIPANAPYVDARDSLDHADHGEAVP